MLGPRRHRSRTGISSFSNFDGIWIAFDSFGSYLCYVCTYSTHGETVRARNTIMPLNAFVSRSSWMECLRFFLSFLPLFLSLSFFHFLLYLLKLSLGYTHTLTHIFIYSHMRDGTKKRDEKLANRNYASHMGEDRGVRTSRECVRSIGTGGKSSLCFLKPQCFLLNVPLIICIQDAQPYTD